ncbi:MAG: aminoacyl-tRNA hydrolase [bacterium]|nr:aminoacyl-tRNA hydrolase [bacterium]
MHLFVGLGNRGQEFEGTRHNIGRETLIAARKKFGLPPFASDPNLRSLVSEGRIGRERVALVLPETFVNKSGSAVLPALRHFKVKAKDVVLIHDDVDMLLGSTKLSFGRNSGGHKGVESVMRALKTKDFWRMRIGVQKKRRVPGEDLVLQKFRGNEIAIVKKVVQKSLQAVTDIAKGDPEHAMNAFNQ